MMARLMLNLRQQAEVGTPSERNVISGAWEQEATQFAADAHGNFLEIVEHGELPERPELEASCSYIVA
jgi:hypothetical protein